TDSAASPLQTNGTENLCDRAPPPASLRYVQPAHAGSEKSGQRRKALRSRRPEPRSIRSSLRLDGRSKDSYLCGVRCSKPPLTPPAECSAWTDSFAPGE